MSPGNVVTCIHNLFPMEQRPNQENHLNIELSEEIADGIYANLAIISHSDAEFVMDFVRMLPGTPKARVKSRIVMTPSHAKRFMRALKENIDKYEAMFGRIDQNAPENPPFPPTFGGPTGFA